MFVPSLNSMTNALNKIQLASGVWCFEGGQVPLNNSGLVVGSRGALVVDSHICTLTTYQQLALVSELLPANTALDYLVNTNFRGDHSFGNFLFPVTCKVIGHQSNIDAMSNFSQERCLMDQAMGEGGLLNDISWRLPDITFDRNLRIDLGGKALDIYCFGKANSIGDAFVFDAKERILFSGNAILGSGLIPNVVGGDVESYLLVLKKIKGLGCIDTIVPGHGSVGDSNLLDHHLVYLESLLSDSRDGWVEDFYRYGVSSMGNGCLPMLKSIHSQNLAEYSTYCELDRG